MPVLVASVKLWDDPVGAVAWDDERGFATFEYEPSFLRKQLEIAPLTMPQSLKSTPFRNCVARHSTVCRGY